MKSKQNNITQLVTLKQIRTSFFNIYHASKNDIPPGAGLIHDQTVKLLKFLIPQSSSVLDIGCGKGLLLNELNPINGLGIDISNVAISKAKEKFPHLEFIEGDMEKGITLNRKFDYILLSNTIGDFLDVLEALKNTKPFCNPTTRIIINYYNALWDPIIQTATLLGLRKSGFKKNWFSLRDIKTMLNLSGFQVITSGTKLLCPFKIPLIAPFLNKFIAILPFFRGLNLITYAVARGINLGEEEAGEKSVTIVIPTRNEKGNIRAAVERTPQLGSHTELLFVDGDSTDGTIEEIKKYIALYDGKRDIKLLHQVENSSTGTNTKMLKLGKGDAVRKGFSKATGEILMILDSDLTVAPEELDKFYNAILNNKAEFINGNRLSYPLQKDSMRFLNIIANRFFGILFSWLLDQQVKDTLCGTKVLTREAYFKIAQGRSFFGDFDPFGDFDLLFGAAKLNLKIQDLPIRYYPRTYGEIKIERFKHGLLLLKMCWFAFKRFKLQR